MINLSRTREKIQGWAGRRRTYKCRECGQPFQADLLHPLPEIDRVCPRCRLDTSVYVFEDKHTGKPYRIRARGAELATLRAFNINPNLTFKHTEKE